MNRMDGRVENPGLRQGIHVVAKPVGPLCNLDCGYCFYLEKRSLFGTNASYRMSDQVLSALIHNYAVSQPTPTAEIVWQGGEPTLAGLDFFKKAVREQRRYASQKTFKNSLQTNGTMLTDEWCAWLKQNHFTVGISLDGPEAIHNAYRGDRRGTGSFKSVLRGLRALQKHGVEYNVLACVARDTAKRPLEVYSFLKNEGVEFIQFLPVVERISGEEGSPRGSRLAGPAHLDEAENQQVAPWTVVPEEYADFLIAICEDWVRHDVGAVFVMNFEWALNAWIGNPSPVCVHAPRCGRAVAVEHNGDVYACDHFVYPEYLLGNVADDSLEQMVERSLTRGFGLSKQHSLPEQCRACPVLSGCWGGCPKQRFATTASGEPGLAYLCAGYRKFFLHIRKYLQPLAQLVAKGLPASRIMDSIPRSAG